MSADSPSKVEDQLRQLQEENSSLKAQLGEPDLKAFEQIKELRTTNKRLTDEVKRLTGEGVQLAFKNTQLDKQLKKLQAELENTQAELANTQSDLTNTQGDLESTQTDLENAQSELQASRRHAAELQAQLDEAQDRGRQLDHSVEELKGELHQSRDQVLSHEAELQRQKDELTERQAHMARLQDELSQREGRISKLEQLVNDFKEQFLSGDFDAVSHTEPNGQAYQLLINHLDLALGIPGRTLVDQVFELLEIPKDTQDHNRLEEVFDTLLDTGTQLFSDEQEQQALKDGLKTAWSLIQGEGGGAAPRANAVASTPEPVPVYVPQNNVPEDLTVAAYSAPDSESVSHRPPQEEREHEAPADPFPEVASAESIPTGALPPDSPADAAAAASSALDAMLAEETQSAAAGEEQDGAFDDPFAPSPATAEPESHAEADTHTDTEGSAPAAEPAPVAAAEDLMDDPFAADVADEDVADFMASGGDAGPDSAEVDVDALSQSAAATGAAAALESPAVAAVAETLPTTSTEGTKQNCMALDAEMLRQAAAAAKAAAEPGEVVSENADPDASVDWVPPQAAAKAAQISEALPLINTQPQLAQEMLEQALEIEVRVENEAKANLAVARLKANQHDILPYLNEALGGVEISDLFTLFSAAEATASEELAERLGLFYQFGMNPRADMVKMEVGLGMGKRGLNREFVGSIGNAEEEDIVAYLRDNLIPKAGLKLPVPSAKFEERLESTGPAAFVGTLRQALRAVDYTLFDFPDLKVLTYDGPDSFLVDASSEPELTLVFHREIEGMPPEELCFLVFRHLVRMYRGHSQLAHQSSALTDAHRLQLAKAAVELFLEEHSLPHPSLMRRLEALSADTPGFQTQCSQLLQHWYEATSWDPFSWTREYIFDDLVFTNRLNPVADHAAARLTGITAATYGCLRDELLGQPDLLEEFQDGLNDLFEQKPALSSARMRVQRMWNEFLLEE
jgi:predicted  nucleic acid-binding Zn-ribbon protein